MRQLPPFVPNSGILPAYRKHKPYALGARTLRIPFAVIFTVAALLMACSSGSTSPPTQVTNETRTDARPSATATSAAVATLAQPVTSATTEPTLTTVPAASPATGTPRTPAPQEPTATVAPTVNPGPPPRTQTPSTTSPTPAPTTIHTSELGIPVERSLPSETADGRIVPVDVGEATIRLQGLQFHTPVIFAEENEPSLLGAVSLEQAALAVDPLAGRLIPTNLLRL